MIQNWSYQCCIVLLLMIMIQLISIHQQQRQQQEYRHTTTNKSYIIVVHSFSTNTKTIHSMNNIQSIRKYTCTMHHSSMMSNTICRSLDAYNRPKVRNTLRLHATTPSKSTTDMSLNNSTIIYDNNNESNNNNDNNHELLDETSTYNKNDIIIPVVVSSHSTTNRHNIIQSYIQEHIFMGIPLSFELIAIITIYFVEGGLGLARLAQSYLLKDILHLGPVELSTLSGLFILPWTIKPIYGFLSDGFPLFQYKRKSYLILCGLLGSCSYGLLSYETFWDQLTLSTSTQGTIVALMLGSACIAFSDVVADGIVVTRTREMALVQQQNEVEQSIGSVDGAIETINTKNHDSAKTAGGLQSLCWGASAIGGLLSAYFSGSLLEIMSVRSIFGITAILPFLVALTAFAMKEERVVVQNHALDIENNESTLDTTTTPYLNIVQDQIKSLWNAFQQSSIWKPTLFIFLWQSTPTSEGAFFYFLTNDLLLGPEFLGRVRFITAAAGLLGVFLYNQYFKYIQIKNILFWSTILSFPLGLLPVLLITHMNRELGIPDTWLIYGDDVALAVLGTIAFMPTLVLAARLCPPGIEAVLFATLMSIYNGASTVGTELGALLTKLAGITESNFDNLALLTVVCNISSLWPLLLIGWLDEVGKVSEADLKSSTVVVDATTGSNDSNS
jgi:folate/biopterin transporter